MDTSDNQNKEQAPVFNNPAISRSKQVSQRDGETVPSGNSRKKMIVVTASTFGILIIVIGALGWLPSIIGRCTSLGCGIGQAISMLIMAILLVVGSIVLSVQISGYKKALCEKQHETPVQARSSRLNNAVSVFLLIIASICTAVGCLNLGSSVGMLASAINFLSFSLWLSIAIVLLNIKAKAVEVSTIFIMCAATAIIVVLTTYSILINVDVGFIENIFAVAGSLAALIMVIVFLLLRTKEITNMVVARIVIILMALISIICVSAFFGSKKDCEMQKVRRFELGRIRERTESEESEYQELIKSSIKCENLR